MCAFLHRSSTHAARCRRTLAAAAARFKLHQQEAPPGTVYETFTLGWLNMVRALLCCMQAAHPGARPRGTRSHPQQLPRAPVCRDEQLIHTRSRTAARPPQVLHALWTPVLERHLADVAMESLQRAFNEARTSPPPAGLGPACMCRRGAMRQCQHQQAREPWHACPLHRCWSNAARRRPSSTSARVRIWCCLHAACMQSRALFQVVCFACYAGQTYITVHHAARAAAATSHD